MCYIVFVIDGGHHSLNTCAKDELDPAFLKSVSLFDFHFGRGITAPEFLEPLVEHLQSEASDPLVKEANTAQAFINFALGDQQRPNVSAIKYLVDQGLNINSRTRQSLSPLLYVTKRGNFAAAKALVENRADPNVCDFQGKNSLWWAAARGNNALADLLINFGAKNCVSSSGVSVKSIHRRRHSGWHSPVETIENCPKDDAFVLGRFILQAKEEEVIELLKEKPFLLTMKIVGSQNPLNLASIYGLEKLQIYLLDQGVDPEIADNFGRNALNRSLTKKHYKLAINLIDRAAQIRSPQLNVRNANLKLVARIKPEESEKLLTKVIERASKEELEELLKYAVIESNFGLVGLLLLSGVDINKQDLSSRTVYDYALRSHDLEMADLLSDFGARPSAKSLALQIKQVVKSS